ncbi:T9SS type A sorting domain-containing protein [bacterium]|nr:T9SS type A sorting domain-containing protein [bacterium]
MKRIVGQFPLVYLILIILAATRLDAAHKILFIGDSITKGKECEPGFRDDVHAHLSQLGFPFQFVGSEEEASIYRGFFFSGAITPEFYENSGAYNVAGEMDEWKPDIVVVHLGSNDFWLYNQYIKGGPYTTDGGLTFTDQVSGHLAKLTAYLAQWHDGRRGTHLETLFLCQIIPKTWRHMGDAGIPLLNSDLETMVQDIEAGRVPAIPPGLVRLVDQFTGFTSDMFADDNHPNCYGYRHMAEVFLEAFKTLPLYIMASGVAGQQALPGDPVPDPVLFRVTDGFGNPAAGVPVQFDVPFGDAVLLSSDSALSDSNGTVQVSVGMGWADSSWIRARASGLVDSIAVQTLLPRDHIYLAGSVQYLGNGLPVADVKMQWHGTDSEVFTDQAGHFKLDGVPLNQTVTLVPEKEDLSPQAVDVDIYDASLIARHVVGLDVFGPSQMQAADMDGDGETTMMDAALVARLVVGLEIPENTAIGSWNFWPDELVCASSADDVDTLSFTGVRTGDIVASWDIQNDASPYQVCFGSPVLAKTVAQETFDMPVYVAGDGVLSSAFHVHWDTARTSFTGVAAVREGFHAEWNQDSAGHLNVAVYGAEPASGYMELVTLSFITENEFPQVWLDQVSVNQYHIVQETAGITEQAEGTGRETVLKNYPNPFNGKTAVDFTLETATWVTIQIVNVLGQQVRLISDREWSAGPHQVIWDGRNQQGADLPSGIYFMVLENGQRTTIKRMQLLR